MNDKVNHPFAYTEITALLGLDGFSLNPDGGMTRRRTGCAFYFSSLNKYKTTGEFLSDFPHYADPQWKEVADLSDWKIEDLKVQVDLAVTGEDFEWAAKVKKEIDKR